MMKKLAAGLITLLLMSANFTAQEVKTVPILLTAPTLLTAANKVDGIELPADQIVTPDEGFVAITAKCKGSIKWLVISNVKVKFVTIDATNSIIVSVPITSGDLVTLFAIGLVDGKNTEFAKTTIQVSGDPTPTPAPTPIPPPPTPPTPTPISGKFHLTMIVDMNAATPDLAALLNNVSLRKTIADRGGFLRIYDKSSPIIVQKKLEKLIQNGSTIILQSADGTVLNETALSLPKTDIEVMALINRYVR